MATSNPVCLKCGREMEVAGVGWLVVYAAYQPPEPYEIRRGDLCRCTICGQAVVTKFAAGQPMGRHMGEPFYHEIATAVLTGKVVVAWERAGHPAAGITEATRKWLMAWVGERRAAREEGRP